jgi:hypothetical protein
MKNKINYSFLIIFSALALPALAYQIPEQKDPAVQLVLQSLVECGKQKLGGDDGVDVAYQMGEQANRQIVAYCKAGKKQQAREVAEYYAATEEGKAALECAGQLKPLIEQNAVQNLLGVYKTMVNDIVSGQIPYDVCVGIQSGYGGGAYGG